MRSRSRFSIVFIVIVLLVVFLLRFGSRLINQINENGNRENAGIERLNRHPSEITYTRHARCRMDCRHIDESEVREILEKGIVNYRKSEPKHQPDPTFALEGITHDNQQVRIVFAASGNKTVVITCIDLQREWSCNCN